MTCPSCLQNCDPQVTDKCTKYTGAEITELGICKGMSLFEVEDIILNELVSIGDAILIQDVEGTCEFITTLLAASTSSPYSIQEFAEIIYTGLCQLNTKIETITPTAFSFNTSCLTGDVSSRDKIIQALITRSCSVDTRLSDVEEDYVKQSDLCNQVAVCLATMPPVDSGSIQWNSRMIPYAPIPYIGPISNFDNTGKGLSSMGFEKVYLMNGLNGTQDWRGRSPIGALLNVPGAALDTAVNPALPANISYNYAVGTKAGASSVALALTQMPAHAHSVTDPGHTHKQKLTYLYSGVQYENGAIDDGAERPLLSKPADTDLAYTGISIGSTGSGQAHTNLHPVIGCLYIIYIP